MYVSEKLKQAAKDILEGATDEPAFGAFIEKQQNEYILPPPKSGIWEFQTKEPRSFVFRPPPMFAPTDPSEDENEPSVFALRERMQEIITKFDQNFRAYQFLLELGTLTAEQRTAAYNQRLRSDPEFAAEMEGYQRELEALERLLPDLAKLAAAAESQPKVAPAQELLPESDPT